MNEKQGQWKEKVSDFFNICQDELKKTTKIGKKMLNASKTNTELHETYEKIGQLAVSEMRANNLKWDHEEVAGLMENIKKCEADLAEIEKEVQSIKEECSQAAETEKPSGPEKSEDKTEN